MFYVVKSWWRKRWHVRMIGHTMGDDFWIASFRNKDDAERFARDRT